MNPPDPTPAEEASRTTYGHRNWYRAHLMAEWCFMVQEAMRVHNVSMEELHDRLKGTLRIDQLKPIVEGHESRVTLDQMAEIMRCLDMQVHMHAQPLKHPRPDAKSYPQERQAEQ